MSLIARWRTAGDTLADVALRYLHREAHSGELLGAIREWKELVADPPQTQGAVAEVAKLRAGISCARGLCTDEAPHTEIDAMLGRALDPPGGQ